MENNPMPLFKGKIDEFIENNPNIIEDSQNKIDEYGTITKSDEKDRIIYIRDKNGNEKFFEYGDFGIIYRKGYEEPDLEEFFTYDEYGNEIKYENSKGFICEMRYDNKNRVIANWDTNGNKNLYEYDEKDRIIYQEINDKIARKTIYQYGELQNFTYTYNSENDSITIEYRDYKNGYKLYRTLEDGTEQWFQNSELIKEIPFNQENNK